MKKLETDKFPFPSTEEKLNELTLEKFLWLLKGIDFRREHQLYPNAINILKIFDKEHSVTVN